MALSRLVSGLAVLVLTAALVPQLPAVQAAARTPLAAPRPELRAQPAEIRMAHYSARDFATPAKTLPRALVHAVNADLGIGAASYLARSAAAAQADRVLDALRGSGVAVNGAVLSGTQLQVYVPDRDAAAEVEARGATPIVGSDPGSGRTVTATAQAGVAPTSPVRGEDLLGGDVWGYLGSDGRGAICSVGFTGYDRSSGAREFVTAGHCASPNNADYLTPADGVAHAWFDTEAGTVEAAVAGVIPAPFDLSAALGSVSGGVFHYGAGDDFGIVPLNAAATTPVAGVTTWGGSSSGANSIGYQNSGIPLAVIGVTQAIKGMPICHSGGTTGFQCGTVDEPTTTAIVSNQLVSAFGTTICTAPGDSGGSFVSGNYAVGILSGGGDCATGSHGAALSVGYGLLLSPGRSGNNSVYNKSDFEVAVQVPDPRVTAANAVRLAGVVPNGAPGTTVSVSVDGGPAQTTTTATDETNTADQAWSFALSNVAAGAHSYRVTASYGTRSVSHTITGDFTARVATPGTVTITDAPAAGGAGSVLTAAVDGFSPSDLEYSYAWTRNDEPLSETSSSIAAAASTGHDDSYLVTVTARADGLMPIRLTSAPFVVPRSAPPILDPPPQPSDPIPLPVDPVQQQAPDPLPTLTPLVPRISGTPKVGARIAVSWPTPYPSGTVIQFQWYADRKPLAGAHSSALTVPPSAAGKRISVQVTAGLWASIVTTASTSTAKTAKGTLKTGAVKIAGTHKTGKVLTVKRGGSWTGGVSIRIQWFAGGRPIRGATRSRLRLTTATASKHITVRLTASRNGYATAIRSTH